MSKSSRTLPDINALRELFYANPTALGEYAEVASAELPALARRLLDHDHHMTVTMEEYCGCPVNVRVLEVRRFPPYYARKIVLLRSSDEAVVQFGIVRLNFDVIPAPIRREIEAETKPLGRILIEHEILRKVRLAKLWRISPGPDLLTALDMAQPEALWGRTATIELDGQAAVDLLEIPAPPLPPRLKA